MTITPNPSEVLISPSFLQMSGMTLGSMIEADQRLRAHEMHMRHQKKLQRDAEVWRRYEADYLGKVAPSVKQEPGSLGERERGSRGID